MPWVSRPGRKDSRRRLRRWRYDHSQGMAAFWIGAAVVGAAAVLVAAARIVTP